MKILKVMCNGLFPVEHCDFFAYCPNEHQAALMIGAHRMSTGHLELWSQWTDESWEIDNIDTDVGMKE